MLIFYAPLTPDICGRIAFILDLVTPSKAELFQEKRALQLCFTKLRRRFQCQMILEFMTRVSARSENRQGECQCTSVDAFCVRDISRIWNSCRSSSFT